MNIELENKLVEKYSEFFEYLKEYDGPIMPIQFGFECGSFSKEENAIEYRDKLNKKYN